MVGAIRRRAPSNGPAIVASGLVAVLLATSTRYGWFRDELYFRALSRRLGVAFVDVPPLTPFVARLTATVFGDSLVALRVWPALCVAGIVLVNASLASKLGGDPRARTIAAVAVACSPIALIFGHVFHYAAFDLLAWSVVVWSVVHLNAGGSPRWWLGVGATVGIGYENKNLITLVVIGLIVGLIASGRSAVFRSRWFVAGVVLASVLAAPNVIWQLQHGLPEAAMAARIRSESSLADRALVVPFQAAFVGVPVVGVALRGFRHLWRRPEFRFLPIAYLCVLGIVVMTGGKHYYTAGLLPVFLAAGAVSDSTRPRGRRLFVALAVSAIVSAFIGLPLLPQSAVAASPIPAVYPDVVESIGWPEFVSQVTAVRDRLPVADQRNARLLVRNYGEAGALERFGVGLPPVWSPHNQYWHWGPPSVASGVEAVIAVGFERGMLEQVFDQVDAVGRIEMPDRVDSQEQHARLFLCRHLRSSWPTSWALLKNYG